MWFYSRLKLHLDTVRLLHGWKRTLDSERNQSRKHCDVSYLPNGIPHHYENEQVFMRLMQLCSKEARRATCFRLSVVRHLYPHAKVQDWFIHIPLIPSRDETTNEGMTLTNAAILENIGMLEKKECGQYSLGLNAKSNLYSCMVMLWRS